MRANIGQDSYCIWYKRLISNKCTPKTDSSCIDHFRNPDLYLSDIGQNQTDVCLPGCKFTPNDSNYCKSVDIVDNKLLCETYETKDTCLSNEMCKWGNGECKLSIDNCSINSTKEEGNTDSLSSNKK